MEKVLKDFQEKYPTRAEKEKALQTMTEEQIDELVRACGTMQGKIFYSSFKKKKAEIHSSTEDEA